MPDAGADDTGTTDQDQSMEEILQSIRKIIAEENDSVEGDDGAEEAPEAAMAEPAIDTAVETGDDEEYPAQGAADSDVLELTDIVEDEVAEVAEAMSEPAPAVAAETATPPTTDKAGDAGSDILSNIDSAITPEASAPAPEAPATAPIPTPTADPAAAATDSLLSEESAAAASAALKSINTLKASPAPAMSSPEFRSGTTVEDLTIEALRPMLKEWLDNNLPVMVERIVEREIRKLTE